MLFRIRQALAYRYFHLRVSGLADTPPVRSHTGSRCELHTMLGRRDLTMYLLAVKSLMSFDPDLAVVVHSDGSLGERDFEHIAAHVTDARFVHFEEAEARAQNRLASALLSEWRAKDAAYRRLIDVELWRDRDRVVILDSDVLTLHKPMDLIAWIAGGQRPFLLGQGGGNRPGPTGSGAHVQALFQQHVPELSQLTGYPNRFLQGATAGFCGYKNEISLERIECALRASLSLGLPMQQWGGDQCLIIYLLSSAAAERLPEDRYLNFEPKLEGLVDAAVMVHFYGTHRFHGGNYPRLAANTVRRLQAPGGASEGYLDR
jgi:hypothetical protein